MAVDVTQIIPLKKDVFSDPQFVVTDDMTDPLNPIPKTIWMYDTVESCLLSLDSPV
jgi:hypothetical protein